MASTHIEHFPIDSLPPELIHMVFDFLPLESRKAAHLVSHNWHQLLDTQRYISKTALKVCPSTLNSDWALETMKRPFNKVVLSSGGVEDGFEWQQFRDRAQCLLKSWAISKNVTTLTVIMSARAASEVFNPKEMINFIKLEDVTYTPGAKKRRKENIVPQINVNAPNLRRLKIECFNQSCVEFIRLVSLNLKQLVLRFAEKSKFINVMSINTFTQLRELCIHSLPTSLQEAKILSSDITDAITSNLFKLDKLSIRDGMNTFPYVYHLMFAAAINLTYLNVEGVEMHPLALHAVNNITKLEVLQLLADTTYRNWSCEFELCLPELKVLLLFPRLMARAGYLPKLQKLAIQNHSVHVGLLDDNANEALATFSRLSTVEMLHLRDIVFSGETLDVVCSFRSTPQIMLEDIWDNIQILHKIVNSYPGLKLLKMIHCRFRAEAEDPCFGDASDDSEWETMQHAESVGQTLEFYSLEKLTELFPNCKVEVKESYFLKQIGRAPWRQAQTGDELAEGRVK